MKWTEDQAAAIESRGENLLLSAAAGSGKTAVLVERVARLLIEGADIERMLIVTFTRASAADMKEHLVSRLQELAQAGDARLREQAERVDRASISTIHAFCTDFLRGFFQAGGVDPAFRIADNAEVAILRENALQAALRVCYAQASEDFSALSELRSLTEIHDLALSLHSFLSERPDPEAWLNEQLCALEKGEDRFSEELVRAARRALSQALALARQALIVAQNGALHYEATAQGDLDALTALTELSDYTQLQLALRGFAFSRLPVKRGLGEDEYCKQYKNLRQQIKKRKEEAEKALAPELSDALRDLQAGSAELKGLAELVQEMDEQFARDKDNRSLLTFNDLEHRTLRALAIPEVRSSVQARYDYVFVDEYQDVSDVQEAILTQVARGDNLFCVGDMKQSIYRFRHAEPGLFAQKAERYEQRQGGRLIALKSNFRSRARILEFTNAVFERAMCGGSTEILYNEMHRLNPMAAYPPEDAPVELMLLSDQADEEDDEPRTEAEEALLELKDAEFEALAAAKRIHELLGTPAWDAKKGETYPLTYRHFVILTRQAKNVADHVTRILKDKGIPACADLSGGFFEVLEVRLALSLLRLVENRQRDLEWISVLRSPAVGLTSTQLSLIRTFSPTTSYADAVLRYAQEREDDTAFTLRAFVGQLDDWRALCHALPVSQLLFTILRQTGLYAYVGALPGGTQRQANLDVLISRAEGYESRQAGGLTGFLQYVEQVTAAQEDLGEAHTLSENDDVVRVMTIHKSKGLEFPVVIGLQLGNRLKQSRSPLLCAHKQLGLGLEHIDRALGTRRETISRLAIRSRAADENYAEALRILYVLLTRAKERLILIGSAKNAASKLTEAALALDKPVFNRDFLDVLLPAALKMPGSEPFWTLCGELPAIRDGMPRVSCQVVYRLAAAQEETRQAQQDDTALSLLTASHESGEMDERFAWVYPLEGQQALNSKLTASALRRELQDGEQAQSEIAELIEQPAFLSEQGQTPLTGAQRGTAMHRCLQALCFEPLRGLPNAQMGSEIARQADRMVENGQLTEEERHSLLIARLCEFLQSDIGTRLMHSPSVRREWLFVLRLSAMEAYGSNGPDVLVQGRIDCCFEEADGWVLLDYKTDRAQDEDALLSHYREQLSLYAAALRRITGKPVKQTCLCLLSQRRVIDIPTK